MNALTDLASLTAITLDELTACAALLSRLDRKYLVPTADVPALVGGLARHILVLEIDGRREFSYESVYFDTPLLHSYLATARRRRHRFKIRIRRYLDSDLQFVEVKLTATGSADMAVSPSAESTQGWMSATLSAAVDAGTELRIVDADGTLVATYVTTKDTQHLVYSAAAITDGEEYQVVVAGESVATVTAGEAAAGGTGGRMGGPRSGG